MLAVEIQVAIVERNTELIVFVCHLVFTVPTTHHDKLVIYIVYSVDKVHSTR